MKQSENNKSLHNFFGRVTEEQRWTRKADTEVEEVEDDEYADAIVDDESFDEAILQIS